MHKKPMEKTQGKAWETILWDYGSFNINIHNCPLATWLKTSEGTGVCVCVYVSLMASYFRSPIFFFF